MRKTLIPHQSVLEPYSSVLNAWPKETKSGSITWCWLACKTFFFFFPRNCGPFVFRSTHLGSLLKQIKKKKGARWWDDWDEVPPPLYLFIYLYLLWLFFFCETKSRSERRSQFTPHPKHKDLCSASPYTWTSLSSLIVMFFWLFFFLSLSLSLERILCTCNPPDTAITQFLCILLGTKN